MTENTERLATATRSTDTRLPLWLRLVALAVERDTAHRGLACFAPGEVRHLLDVDGLDLAAASVTRAIRMAEDKGFLEKGSSTRALILVPGSMTTLDLAEALAS